METEKKLIGQLSGNIKVHVEYYENSKTPGICFEYYDKEYFKLKPRQYKEFVDIINNVNDNKRNCFTCIHSYICIGKKFINKILKEIPLNFDDEKLTPMLFRKMHETIYAVIAMTCIEYKERSEL